MSNIEKPFGNCVPLSDYYFEHLPSGYVLEIIALDYFKTNDLKYNSQKELSYDINLYFNNFKYISQRISANKVEKTADEFLKNYCNGKAIHFISGKISINLTANNVDLNQQAVGLCNGLAFIGRR